VKDQQFRYLAKGVWFDFIGPNPTFYLRCRKTGIRTYVDEDGHEHRVGSLDAKVYHVSERKGSRHEPA